MDKKNLPSLDELLNRVRQSEPCIKDDEAINWLHAQEDLPLQKHRFKPSKTIIMTSIISILSIAAFLWMKGPDAAVDQTIVHRPLSTESPSTIDHRPLTMDSGRTILDEHFQASNEKFTRAPGSFSDLAPGISPMIQASSAIDHGLWSMVDTPRIDTVRVFKIQSENREHDGNGEAPGIVQEFVFDIQVESPDQAPCRDQVNALVLEPEELKKLGIVSDQGTLLYQQDHTQEGQVKLVFQGTFLSGHSRKDAGASSLLAPDILPLAILSCRGNFEYPESNVPDSNALEAALAVRVNVNEKGDYLIFWFPRNKAILAMLPEETQEMIHNDVELYHQRPWLAQTMALPMMAQIQLKKLPWEPEETTILPNERAEDLGIRVDEGGIHFRRFGAKIDISLNWHNVEILKELNEKEMFEETNVKRLHPLYVSKDHFFQGMPSQVISLNKGSNESFTFDKFRLVAFKVSHPVAGDYLFWYPYSPALKSLLTPNEQKIIEAKLNKIDPAVRFDPKRPDYDKWEELFVEEMPVTEALNAVQPSLPVLKKLGVKIGDQGIIEVNHLFENNTMLIYEFSKGGTRLFDLKADTSLDNQTRNDLLNTSNAIVSITDDLGMMPRMLNMEFQDYKMNELIPVLVRSGQIYTLNDKINKNWRPDIILWLKPTKEVLAILESEGAGAFWGDVTSEEVPDTTQAACRYTELCRNKPGVFNSALLFPNPATSFANFSWVATEESDYSIKLFALNGAEVKAFSNLTAQAGKNQYTMDLSGLPAGIYMMILTSAKGDEMHERLVIRE